MNENREITNVSIEKIIPNIYQPRMKFDDKSINDLANSIKKHNFIQPLILRKSEDAYEIISGERRYRAAKKLDLKTIPAIILYIDTKTAAELVLTESLQKEPLSPLEEAIAYQQLMLLNNCSIEDLATLLGKDKEIIKNKLNLLNLPVEIQEALLNNKISESHAKVLARIANKETQKKLFNRIINERITVKNLEEIIIKEKLNEEENIDEFEDNNDIINLNLLNNSNLLNIINNKKDKTEVKNMDNTQLNFNQYNNLLKEQPKPEMAVNAQPEPIIGNTPVNVKPNDFFPSLEEQPLNMEVPVNNQPEPTAMQMPSFDVPNVGMSGLDMGVPTQPVEAPAMPAQPEPTSMQMPSFDVPNVGMPGLDMGVPTQPVEAPAMPAQPEPTSMQMPSFDVPNVGMPGLDMGVPTQPVEVPAMPAQPEPTSMQMPSFDVPNVGMPGLDMGVPTQPVEAPAMPAQPEPTSMQMPSFDVPNVGMPGLDMGVPTQSVETPSPVQPQAVVIDVMPAVNMIRNLLPLLENSGYKIEIEENDNPNEYQITIKIEK